MNLPRNRTLWIVVVAVAVVVVAAGAFGYYRTSKTPEMRFETVAADRGPIVAKITASGTLSALVTVQVGSQVSGRVQELLVDYNSPVKKDQVIARIEPQLFDAAAEQAKANHLAAQANLAKAQVEARDAKRQADRSAVLATRGLLAQATLDTAQTTADSGQAQVKAAESVVAQTRAALHQAEVNLAYTVIRSPINGVVISRSVDVGQTVAASLQAPTLFVIAEDLRKMQVDTSVAEADVGKLREGMAATFTVDAYAGQTFRGVVRQIRNASQTVQNVVTYDAVIDVQNPDLLLRPGMTANATFVYAEAKDALRAPNTALRFQATPAMLASVSKNGSGGAAGRSRGGKAARSQEAGAERPAGTRTAWVLRNGKAEAVAVGTGISDGTVTEVTSGELRQGDLLITDVSGGASAAAGGPGGGGGMFRRMF